ncbi:MAG: hypothetical protein KF729_09685 [Sandaracinaceae bacterium]|nr:hypothetical protein [Sandaracinaceae bacterium]
MRWLRLTSLLLLAAPAAARAEGPGATRVEVPIAAPGAVLVDGVKVAGELALAPKHVPVRAGRCSASGCTLIVTY